RKRTSPSPARRHGRPGRQNSKDPARRCRPKEPMVFSSADSGTSALLVRTSETAPVDIGFVRFYTISVTVLLLRQPLQNLWFRSAVCRDAEIQIGRELQVAALLPPANR